ncbi:MAG TPA: ABC-type transport auxiliary lipoprotein family protein [Kofleriaceae bacterium]|nr:ABC-type transport auxiliary lipoprotein family protein [Kofleriaceae bacterium]
MNRAISTACASAASFAAAFAAAFAIAFAFAVVLALFAGCAGKVPETRYYQLATATATSGARAAGGGVDTSDAPVLALEPLAAEEAYQDERIVYRASPYRLDYYNYHRWSAPPGMMITGYLEQALERSGKFRAVVRESDSAPFVLGGRLIAIEEVDESRARWLGRVAVELTLKDAQSGEVLWVRELAETEPLTELSQEGLARALSKAMARIATRAIPEIATHARREAAPGARDDGERARAASRATPRGTRGTP